MDDFEDETTPNKQMSAVGHFGGAASHGSHSVLTRTDQSSIGLSRRSNSLAKNMSSFLSTRLGP